MKIDGAVALVTGGAGGIGITIVCPSFVSTGMFDGGRPPRLTPWLAPDALAGKIFDAIAADRTDVREPFMIKLIPLLNALLPTDLKDRFGDLLGTNSAMDGWTGRK